MDALSNRIMSRRNSVGVYTNDYTNIKNKYEGVERQNEEFIYFEAIRLTRDEIPKTTTTAHKIVRLLFLQLFFRFKGIRSDQSSGPVPTGR